MEIFSDGTIQMYAVFHGDGYECSDFVGIFETSDQAEACVAAVKANVQEDWDLRYPEGCTYRESPADIISAKPLIVGQYALPHEVTEHP